MNPAVVECGTSSPGGRRASAGSLLLVAVAAILFLAGSARADLDEAYQALNRADYAAALRLFSEMAEAGDADALYELGRIYSEGLGVPPDDGMAADYYRQAAELGHSGGQVALGYAYDFALGVPHDRMQAEQWYARAMASGSVTGMNNLAYSWADQGIRLDEARGLIMQVLVVAPDEATFLDTLGWILFKQGKYEASLIPLCRASVLESGHPELSRHFGDALWMVGEFARARAQWEHALDLTADPTMLSQSGRDFLGVQDMAAWTADLRARLAHGLTDDTVPATVEIPHACADLTS